MSKPQNHLLICNSFRTCGDPKGVCNKKDSSGLSQYIETELSDRGMDAMVSSTSCMKMCEKGPILVVYPQNWWYGEVDEGKIDDILDALEEGKPAEGRLFE
jgi:(2Fe-2S) ferredoxin